MIKKILIANRGEIAVRIIKACQELNISTVAIYSEADQNALHVQLADESVCIGPPPPLESYLNIDKIVKIAQINNVEAIHPGYGFLAENALFAQRCEAEGIIFIGPNSTALALVGDKLTARKTMTQAGIPTTPGMDSEALSFSDLEKAADRVGYPVLIKASAGGGGKGMRIVQSHGELRDSVAASKREAASAFGSDVIYLEKYIERPRHIEFQILADSHGNAIHLYERECSIQRRHQKIIEESPSLALDDQLRLAMGKTAIQVVQSTGYTNAGTVEFLLDKDNNYYFLEVNARLQVEHPVTELITGIDLVKQQIRIASGEKLSLKQAEVQQRGHAIECRIYAEDPENHFLPSIGKILAVEEPKGPWIRNDSGIYSGIEVSIHYDPILAKLIVWGANREEARQRMINALRQYAIIGIQTTIPILIDILEHPHFINGNLATDFIGTHFNNWKPKADNQKLALALAAMNFINKPNSRQRTNQEKQVSPWLTLGEWRVIP